MTLFLAHLKFNFLELLRHPGYIISTLVFPSLFFSVFAAPNIDDVDSASTFTASFAAFGILGVVFFQFTISVVNERATQWESFVRTLPVHSAIRTWSRVTLTLLFGIASALLVYLVSYIVVDFHVTFSMLFKILVALILGSLPFAMLGMSLGYILNPTSALPIMNMIYLILSFSGGLWLPPEALPKFIENVSVYLPTRHLAEVLWATTRGDSIPVSSVVYLVVSLLIFSVTSYYLSRRFESLQYS